MEQNLLKIRMTVTIETNTHAKPPARNQLKKHKKNKDHLLFQIK